MLYRSMAVASKSSSYNLLGLNATTSMRAEVPVAKEPEVIVTSKLFYFFLMIRHIGGVGSQSSCQTSKCYRSMTWGSKQWGVCRASCGSIPMARFDAINLLAAREVHPYQLLCIQVEVYSIYNTTYHEPPAALLMKKLFSGPIASTALSPMLLKPTIGPDSMLYSRCSLSHTPSIALFSAYRSLL